MTAARYSYDVQPRCTVCHKLLAEKVTRPWSIRCGRCKNENHSEDKRVRKLIYVETDDRHVYISEADHGG